MAKDNIDLDNLRHSCAHLLAATVLKLYPHAKNAIGPSIENGFYQDFDLGEIKISEDDLEKIEKKMREVLASWTTFEIKEVDPDQAKKDFAWNKYKLELIDEFAAEGKTLTETKQGNFLDLCRGGHVSNPSESLRHFKLLSVAGAYWRGSEKNPMLTRIYGTCFPTQKELDNYLAQLEEAKLRDHKKLGPQLDLFVFSDLVGAGLPLWTPKGTLLRNTLDDFVWQLRSAAGYEKVEIPHITKKELYETSGHWEKFKDELFRITTREEHEFAMKPMNCPHHTQIYKRRQWSYRDLPQRYANTTMVYRDEQTGELAGLSRVRCITQDDAHVFCRPSQVKQEFLKVWDIVDTFYGAVGFTQLKLRVSGHDPTRQEEYLGDPKLWQKAELELLGIAKERGVDTPLAVGEAAFYGPKVDFMAKDSLGREWQVATIQLDLNMPERFDLFCIDEKGQHEQVVMIHAAIMGSLERFISVIIEHFAGAFPVWLSPIQVQILPIGENNLEYAKVVKEKLEEANIRVEVDQRNETLPAKIRDAQMQKTPYMIIVGGKEEEAKTISVRLRSGQEEKDLKVEDFIIKISTLISQKSLDL